MLFYHRDLPPLFPIIQAPCPTHPAPTEHHTQPAPHPIHVNTHRHPLPTTDDLAVINWAYDNYTHEDKRVQIITNDNVSIR